jgi:hypothetical protein
MPHKVVPVRVEKASSSQRPAASVELTQLLQDYEDATEQYGVIVRYLKAAIQVLSKPECQLLLEFAEIAKKHCEQLHRKIEGRLDTRRSA